MDDERRHLLSVSGSGAETRPDNVHVVCQTEHEEEKEQRVSKPFTCYEILFLCSLSAVTVTSSLSLCIFPPFFPKIAESKGFGAGVYGSIIGTNCLVAFLVTPFIGRHIETLGLKFTLISGICASGTSSILCGLLELHPPGALFVCSAVSIRAVQSLGNAGIIISTFIYTSIQFPSKTGTIFALNRTALSVAQMIGPALGGVLYDVAGYYLPFLVFGALHSVTIIPVIGLAPVSHGVSAVVGRASTPTRDATNSAVMRLPGIWVSFCTFFVSTLSTGFLSITLESQILRKFQLSHIALGLMFGMKDAASTVASPIWGMLCDRYKCTKIYIVICTLAAAVAFSVFGPLPGLAIHQTLYMVVAGLCLYGAAIGGMQICGVMDALREAIGQGLPDDPTTHGVVAGLWNSLSSGGRFISRCGAGFMVDGMGFPYSSSVVVMLHMLLGMAAMIRAMNKCGSSQRRRRRGLRRSGAIYRRAASPKLRESSSGSATPDSLSSDASSASTCRSEAMYVPGKRAAPDSETSVSYLVGHTHKYLKASSYNAVDGMD